MRSGCPIFSAAFVLVAAAGASVCASSHAGEAADGRLGYRTVPIFLLMRPDVQADLKMTSEQVTECHRAAQAFQTRASRLVGRKDQAVVAVRREIDEALTEWLSLHLSAEQFGRFEQIDLQWEGAAAMLSRPFLDESLSLTPDQKKRVSECISQAQAQRARTGWSYEDHVNLTRKAIAILTERQRELWIHLIGPRCAFSVAAKTQTAQRPTTAATDRGQDARAPRP